MGVYIGVNSSTKTDFRRKRDVDDQVSGTGYRFVGVLRVPEVFQLFSLSEHLFDKNTKIRRIRITRPKAKLGS
jgi:hypothetical protein